MKHWTKGGLCAALFFTALTFSVAAAQTGGAESDNDMSGHDMNTGGMSGGMAHDMSGGAEASSEPLSVIAVGDYVLHVQPHVTADGDVRLGLRLDTGTEDAPLTLSELDLSATAPDGSEQGLEVAQAGDVALATLPSFQAGVWRVSGTLSGQEVSFPLALYQQDPFYLALMPAPSLSARGLSEVYAYAYEDGSFIHGDYTLQFDMTGMAHASDDEVTTLEHTHFERTFGELDEAVSANRAPLSFAMAGAWNMSVTVTHEGEMDQATFEVTVLDE